MHPERGVAELKLSTSYLLPGMRLARPVYGQSGELLLGKGAGLTLRNIVSLQRCRVLAVDIESPFGFDDEERNIIEDEMRLGIMNVVREWTLKNENKLERIANTVEVIIDEILSGKEVAEGLTQICSADIYTYAHSVDVCILSLSVGVKLGYARPKLLRLGVGSLLHDLGKTKIPIEILNKPDELTPDEFNEMKKHSEYGYQIFQRIRGFSSQSASIILCHHERYDGSGYPHGLKGDKISEMSVICAISDVYNAITTDRIYRDALPPHEAYEMMMASGDLFFNFKVVKAFLKCVTPYPVGSMVGLSNNVVGCVCRLNKGIPYRPVVKVLNSEEEIDLQNERNIVITGLIRPEEISELVVKGNTPGAGFYEHKTDKSYNQHVCQFNELK
ncbi:MAG: HD-GYP domain-containing protein [Peptococcaceae bacterium]|nr:MAG: HD-GYP domain-containing protein [Peptococcaceae bacterium]